MMLTCRIWYATRAPTMSKESSRIADRPKHRSHLSPSSATGPSEISGPVHHLSFQAFRPKDSLALRKID